MMIANMKEANSKKAEGLMPTVPTQEALCEDIRSKLVEMAEYKDDYYRPLVDQFVEYINDTQCDDIFSDIVSADGNWCEMNCGETSPNFNANCLKKWLEVKELERKERDMRLK